MEKEACNIISLNDDLHRAFPTTQFLWHPSATCNGGYTSNFEWKGVRNTELIARMKQHHSGAEVIELTLHDAYVYWK
jgi:hypothetical protein